MSDFILDAYEITDQGSKLLDAAHIIDLSLIHI